MGRLGGAWLSLDLAPTEGYLGVGRDTGLGRSQPPMRGQGSGLRVCEPAGDKPKVEPKKRR